MPRQYEYKEVEIKDLLLDEENPRFASSILVQKSANQIGQETVIEHLLRYSNVIELANRINEVGELHGSEIITCIRKGNKYVVLEGNRRTCACKLLLDRSIIPEHYKSKITFITERTKANITKVMVTIYPDRESVQAYLSDRHITGVKKWSALEKNNYYMNLFYQYGDVAEVKKHTSDSVSVVTKSIIKYQFFMDVFNVLKLEYEGLEIEKIDYLPMVDRFMETLVGNDEDVGLKLELDKEKLVYVCMSEKKDIYDNILLKVGEAFLIRKEKRLCKENEVPKIVSSEIYAKKDQKKLILDDVRIPGLLDLIQKYKNNKQSIQYGGNENNNGLNLQQDVTDSKNEKGMLHEEKEGNIGQSSEQKKATDTTDDKDMDKTDKNENNSTNINQERYVPEIRYNPKRYKGETLYFTRDEANKFQLATENDYNLKIKSLLYDLGKFSVYTHPYTVALLYRTLLEICTKRVYHVKASEIGRTYNENDLKSNMLYLTNNFLFNKSKQKDLPKIKETIKEYLSGTDIIQILNLYIHYSNSVDENLILSSWKSLKKYVQSCLEK